MSIFFVLGQLEPKPFLDDGSNKVAIIPFPYIYFKGLFVSFNVEWSVNAVSEIDHEKKFSELVDFVIDAVIAHVLQQFGLDFT